MKKISILLINIGLTLSVLPSQMTPFKDIKNNIAFSAMRCGQDEVLVNSGGWKLRARDFISKGYIPVRVRIDNKSEIVISMSDKSIQNLDIDIHALADSLKYYEIGRSLLWWGLRTIICISAAIGGFINSIKNVSLITPPGAQPRIETGAERTSRIFWSRITYVGLAGLAINTGMLLPYDYVTLHGLNKRLIGELHNALCTGSVIVKPEATIEKLFLIPESKSRFEFSVFREHTDERYATFVVMCAGLS